MNRNIFVETAFAFAFVIFGATPVLASSPRAVPVCNIEGRIESVEFQDTYVHPCVNNPDSCPSDSTNGYQARYSIDIYVESVSKTYPECEDEYSVGSLLSVYIDKTTVKDNEVFSADQNIKGEVSFGMNGRYLNSYSLVDKSRTIRTFILSPLRISLGSILVLLVLSGIAYLIILSRRKKVEIEK
jgi:hypothetical protein